MCFVSETCPNPVLHPVCCDVMEMQLTPPSTPSVRTTPDSFPAEPSEAAEHQLDSADALHSMLDGIAAVAEAEVLGERRRWGGRALSARDRGIGGAFWVMVGIKVVIGGVIGR